MSNSNLALNNDPTSGSYQELPIYSLASSHVSQGKSPNSLDEGTIIEDSLKENTSNTSSPGKLLSSPKALRPSADMTRTNTLLASRKARTHSIVIQKLRGYIDTINGEEFTAIFTDPSGHKPDVRMSFSIDDVSEGDRELISENAIFDWVMSRERKSHGQIANKEVLIFRRFPMWKKSDLEVRSDKVNAFNEWLNPSTEI